MKKFFIAITAAIIIFGCKSTEVKLTGEDQKTGDLCEHEYTQEQIDRELAKLEVIMNRADYADDTSFANFREVKTKGIGSGILYRSSHPAMPGPRADMAARLSDRARIFTIVSILDTRRELTLHAATVPWYNSYINRDAITALFAGNEYFESNFAEKLYEGIRFMVRRRGPYLIHCDNGMDATGFVMVVLEALMGASPDEIIEDYMQSYVNYYGISKDDDAYTIISQIPHSYLCTMNEGRTVNAGNTSQAAELYLRNIAKLNTTAINELKQLLAGH